MAFAGMMIATVVLFVLGVILVLGFIFLGIGIILRLRKHKVASTVFFVLGGINLIGLLILILTVVFQPKEIKTRSGVIKLQKSWIREYEECLSSHDLKKMDKLLTKHPEMISYTDINAVLLLDYGLYNCDIEMMQLALDHGAVFDDPTRYDHSVFYSSLDSFYDELDYPSWEKDPADLITKGQTTQEMIDAVAFAIDHGAALSWKTGNDYETGNFLAKTRFWTKQDGPMSENDRRLVNLVRDHMPKDSDNSEDSE